jgi:hypothetical protein
MRFQAQSEGLSWKVVDTEIFYRNGNQRVERWCRDEAEAKAIADNLNKTRGHAADAVHNQQDLPKASIQCVARATQFLHAAIRTHSHIFLFV